MSEGAAPRPRLHEKQAISRRRVRKRAVVILLIASVVVLLLCALAYRPATLVGVNGDDLAHSLGGGDLLGQNSCFSRGNDVWRCSITDNGGSGGASYRVTTHSSFGCWSAERIGSGSTEGGTPKQASGCITGFDVLSPF